MRRTPVRPQLRAMSVAFDDQGEIVPRRGTTSNLRALSFAGPWPPMFASRGPYRSSGSNTAACGSKRGRVDEVNETGVEAGYRGLRRRMAANRFSRRARVNAGAP